MYQKNKINQKSNDDTLIVAFERDTELANFDPTRINLASQYWILDNIYSQLILRDATGQILPGIAKEFDWDGNSLIFKIRENLLASDGLPITIEDIVFSLKRLAVLGGTHSDIGAMLCGKKPQSIEEPCEGIQVDGSKLILKVENKDMIYLESFAVPDFSIIPRRATDPKTLKIIDYRVTSGLYYIEERLSNGDLKLNINQNHYLYQNDIPQKILLKNKLRAPNVFEALRTGEVSYIPSLASGPMVETLEFVKSHIDEYQFHLTQGLKVQWAQPTALFQSLPLKEKRGIFGALLLAYENMIRPELRLVEAIQFFAEGGFGTLSPIQRIQVEEFRKSVRESATPYKGNVVIASVSGATDFTRKLLSPFFPNATYVSEIDPLELRENNSDATRPHFQVGAQDSGFFEDFPELNYIVNSGTLGMTQTERSSFLREYQLERDSTKRQLLLRDIHFKSLMNMDFIPLIRAPYVSITSKPWKMEFSPYFAADPFWRIHHE